MNVIKKIPYLLSFALFLACSSDNHDAKVQIEFKEKQNTATNTNITSLTTTKASKLGIKIIAVYLSEDIDENNNNTGLTPMIYLNPECNSNITTCDVEEREGIEHIVSTFFDFAKNEEEVNQVINANSQTVSAGTYKYIRMEFCKYNEQNTITLELKGTINDNEVTYHGIYEGCVITRKFETPLTIKEGDEVVVTLGYDPNNSFLYSTNQDDLNSCSTTIQSTEIGGTTYYYCWKLPQFMPCAKVNGEEIVCKTE